MDKDGQRWALMVQGDEAAFEALFERYYAQLSTYAARFGYDASFAAECVQELFVKIWQNRAHLSQPASVKHYLFKALRNTIYNRVEARKRELYIGSLEDLIGFDLVYEPGDQAYPFSGVSDELQHQLDRLTARQREAIYLFYFEELTYQEIADLFQINVTAAYKLVYRALENLRSGYVPSSSPIAQPHMARSLGHGEEPSR